MQGVPMKLLGTILMALASAGWALAPGDPVVVRCKDGSSVSGTLAALSATEVSVNLGGAAQTWDMAKVASVEAPAPAAAAPAPAAPAAPASPGLAPLPKLG